MNYFVKFILLNIRGSRELFCLKPSFFKIVEKTIDKLCVCLVMSSPFHPMGCDLPGSSVPGTFFTHEYWIGLPFPPPGDLPNPEAKPTFPARPVLAGRFFTTEPLGKPVITKYT